MTEISKLPDDLEKVDLMCFPQKPEWVAENPKRPGFQVCADEELFESTDPENVEDDIPF